MQKFCRCKKQRRTGFEFPSRGGNVASITETGESPARCSDFIRFVLWLSGGISTNMPRRPDCLSRKILAPSQKRLYREKGHKIWSGNIPATISQSAGARQVYSSDMKCWRRMNSSHAHSHIHGGRALETKKYIFLDWTTHELNALKKTFHWLYCGHIKSQSGFREFQESSHPLPSVQPAKYVAASRQYLR